MAKGIKKDKPEDYVFGRPTVYSPEIADQICDELMCTDRGLHSICNSNEKFPSAKTVWDWLNKHEDFRNKYTHAKALQADYLIEQTIEIADDSSNDTTILEFPSGTKEVENREWTNRSKLRVETRFKAAAMLAPKKYGTKVDLGVTIKKLGKDLEDSESFE